MTIYAFGHSTRTIGETIEMLRAHGVSLVCDIRTVPRSRHNPQFNSSELAASLEENGIGYLHLEKLGGFRRPDRNSDLNAGWRNSSFRGYADYMQSADFEAGLRELLALASNETVAIMCSEGNRFRCHRSLVSDALLVHGLTVIHISGPGPGTAHKLTPFALIEGRKIVYPAISK